MKTKNCTFLGNAYFFVLKPAIGGDTK